MAKLSVQERLERLREAGRKQSGQGGQQSSPAPAATSGRTTAGMTVRERLNRLKEAGRQQSPSLPTVTSQAAGETAGRKKAGRPTTAGKPGKITSPAREAERRAEELRTLRDKGLTMVYMGLESGCDDVLKRMRKGHMSAEIVEMGRKVRRCGMALSVTAITGLGGPELLERHAIETAEAFNAMNPEYIGMLTLMVEPETPLYDWVRDGSFQLLTQPQVLEETRLLMEHLDSPGSVFRMNHASNYLVLKGTLNRDKEAMLRTIDAAEHDLSRLRPEEWRGL